MDQDEMLSQSLEDCLKSLEIARNQYPDLWKNFKEQNPYLNPDHYSSAHHEFLKVPDSDEEIDLATAILHMKRYIAIMEHMLQENSLAPGYRESLEESKAFLRQMLFHFQITLQLLEKSEDVVDEGDLALPDDLKLSSRSARQRRDLLVVRDYEKLLDLCEQILSRFSE